MRAISSETDLADRTCAIDMRKPFATTSCPMVSPIRPTGTVLGHATAVMPANATATINARRYIMIKRDQSNHPDSACAAPRRNFDHS